MKNAALRLDVSRQADACVILKVTVDFAKKTVPAPVTVSWRIPVGRAISTWSPTTGFSRFLPTDWDPRKVASRAAAGAPVLSLINDDGSNACTIAISDAKTPTSITVGVSEEDAELVCSVSLFEAYVSPIDHYEAYISIDRSATSFADAVRRVCSWWETSIGYQKASIPKETYFPLDNTWYSFHQELLNAQDVIDQCRLSSKLGMKTLVVDAGWHTEDKGRGFLYCGDWNVATAKIPCMKTFVQEIHRLGMNVMLWFAVPFAGIHSEEYRRFKDKALFEDSAEGVVILDIRYKEIRDYLIDTCVTAVREFQLDGLKLDFIGRFCLKSTSPQANEQMDICSVEDALDTLLMQLKTELLKINPNIMLEFRQSYIGPEMLKYANMLRVHDSPYDSVKNRVGIIDLRLTSGTTAVHSDPAMWHKNAPIEAVARQLVSTLYGVPQISVRLKELPQEHIEAIRFWLDFYTKHMEILHSSEFYVKNPELGYSQVKACRDGSVVGVNYANVPFELEPFAHEDAQYTLINSSDGERLLICADKDLGACDVVICNCLGERIEEYTANVSKGAMMFHVPVCGFVELSKHTESAGDE